MKIFILAALLSIPPMSNGQDSLLTQSWTNLTREFLNRVKVVESFTALEGSGKSVDSSYTNHLNELCSFLKAKLNENILPDSLLIDSIRTNTLFLFGTIGRISLFIDRDTPVQTRANFVEFEKRFTQAKNRISVVAELYNERCKITGRTDLIY